MARDFAAEVKRQQRAIRKDMKTWPQWMLDACYWAAATFPTRPASPLPRRRRKGNGK